MAALSKLFHSCKFSVKLKGYRIPLFKKAKKRYKMILVYLTLMSLANKKDMKMDI